MLQLSGLCGNATLLGGTEYLLKVQILPLIGDVKHLMGIPVLHTLQNGGQIGGSIDGRSVGFDEDHRRNFLLVTLLSHGNHPSALAENCQTAALQILYHAGDVGIGIAFTQPLFVVDVQRIIDSLQVGQRNAHDVIPDGPVAPATLLQLVSCHMGLFGKHGILLLAGGSGIDLFQIGQSERRFNGVFAGEIGVKIGEVGLALLQLCNDQTHLQTPVTQMDVTDGLIAHKGMKPLQSLTDDSRTQVTNVQRLGDVCSAVVHHNGLSLAHFGNTEVGGGAHLLQIALEEAVRQLQVDKAGHNGLHQRVVTLIQLCYHCVCDHDRCTLILLGGGQCAIALIFAKVGAVGYGNTAKCRVVACIGKGLLHFRSNNIKNFFHYTFPFCCASHSR